ncbi:MAG: hypothetical protein JNL71_00960 [Rhodospirillales bacterium]|nr:hypothetical protein [Rhodospirillales bacterium]
MQTLADIPAAFAVRDAFSADEIGWVGADADVQAVLLGTREGPLADAHAKIASLGKVAAHPRLVGTAAQARIAQSAYWRGWDGTQPLLAGTDGQVAIVFLGWRGGIGAVDAALGRVMSGPAHEFAGLAAKGGAACGPFLVVRYAADGDDVPVLADDCLWQSAWCV